MKNLISIFLFAIIFLQTFSTYILNADYWLNKDYVAGNLCDNKSRPQLHCNGKCYLAKQIAKETGQDKQAPESKKEKFEAQPFFLPGEINFQYKVTGINRIVIHSNTNMPVAGYYSSVFHPPSSQLASRM